MKVSGKEGAKIIAVAAGADLANALMREAGRGGEPWTLDDYNVAVIERNRIMDELHPGEET